MWILFLCLPLATVIFITFTCSKVKPKPKTAPTTSSLPTSRLESSSAAADGPKEPPKASAEPKTKPKSKEKKSKRGKRAASVKTCKPKPKLSMSSNQESSTDAANKLPGTSTQKAKKADTEKKTNNDKMGASSSKNNDSVVSLKSSFTIPTAKLKHTPTPIDKQITCSGENISPTREVEKTQDSISRKIDDLEDTNSGMCSLKMDEHSSEKV
uniref:Uncharacterized protein n=1 Tax=Panagrellus redivivus TaxID=6233 RepID=A0A7E4VUR0_PANRE